MFMREENWMRNALESLISCLDPEPHRAGLIETPERAMKAWQFWTSGYEQDPMAILKTFEDGAEQCDEMVFQGCLPLWSTCEHHLSPFFGVAHIGYIPDGKIVGLSKLSRLTDIFARRLTVQERLTNQIADALDKGLKTKAVGVVLRCRHSCMESRGVQRAGTITYTSALRGLFKTAPDARAEFMQFVSRADANAKV